MKENKFILLNKIDKRVLSILIAIIIIAAGIISAVSFGLLDLDEDADGEDPLFVKIFVDDKEGLIPHTVNFSSLVLNEKGKISYSWDFGDGVTSNERNPSHIYEENGTYKCILEIDDSDGEKKTDFVNILVKRNSQPTVSIEQSTTNPRRPWISALELLPAAFHMDNFAAQDYRQLLDKGLLEPLFGKYDSFYTVEALATDPDGDEIVSYNWTLRPPSYNKRLGGELVEPIYHYKGKVLQIPIEHIYPASNDGYSLTLTVTDSAGQTRSENIQFKVQKSNLKTQIEQNKQLIDLFRTKTWNTLLAGTFAGPVRSLVQSLFTKMNDLPVPILSAAIKALIIVVTFKWNILGFDEIPSWILESIKPILEKRPLISKTVDSLLLALQRMNISGVEELREDLGLENNRPVITNPYPETGAIRVDRDCPYVSIDVSDIEGDKFNVTISGMYLNNVTYTDVTNGTYNATLKSVTPDGLPGREVIEWEVSVVDQNGKPAAYLNNRGEIEHKQKYSFKFSTSA